MALNPVDVTSQVSTEGSTGLPESQAILGGLASSAIFLIVNVTATDLATRTALETASTIGALVRAAGFREPAAGLSCTVSFGSEFWDRIRPAGANRPKELHPFIPISGMPHDAPATPGDLLFHIKSERSDITFELSRLLMDALGDSITVESSTTGFRYYDSRDLLGFVDGTENPTGHGAHEAALISSTDDAEFAGGSYVVVQKYVHDLTSWAQLTTEEQEAVIGRTKSDNVELDESVQPTNSHVSLNTIEDEAGEEHAILRDNLAFGDPSSGEYGTYYIAYSGKLWVTELMLQRMFVGEPPGNSDRILDVSTAVTGTQFFAPSRTLLESLAGDYKSAPQSGGPQHLASQHSAPPQLASHDFASPGAESLGIGSLKGDPS